MSPPNPPEQPHDAAERSDNAPFAVGDAMTTAAASAADSMKSAAVASAGASTGQPTAATMASGTSGAGASEDLIDLGDASAEAHTASTDNADTMTLSVATLKPPSAANKQAAQPPELALDTATHIDLPPNTPLGSQPPSRTPSNAASRGRSSDPSPSRSDKYASEDEPGNESRSEIQSIMEQFSEEGGGPGAEEVMSPRLEVTNPFFGGQHPPRKSSLEPLAPKIAQQIQELQGLRLSSSSPVSVRSRRDLEKSDQLPPVPPKDGSSVYSGKSGWGTEDPVHGVTDTPLSPTISLHRPPPPEPEPEASMPFDFHRFLEQLRNKKADPVARYLKSFLSEFGKRQWMVHEQVKIISDFLAFIANKMAQCEVWRDVSDAEFDNAREGMEKLVMNRLYSQTFSPAIPAPQPIPGAKPKR
jgi:Rab5 GDP/GTP exchange factor